MAAETGLYAYTLALAPLDPDVLLEQGVNDSPLTLVEHRDLVLVVGAVDLDEFGEEGLKRNLEDLAWLERVAVGHDRVARAVATRAPAAPLRLATIFRSEASARARMEEWYDDARAVFDRITGRHEWSVKAYASTPQAAPRDRARPSSGRDYLASRKQAHAERQQASADATEVVERLHHDLHDHAVASRLLQPQDPTLSGHEGEMLLNGAYLVDDEQAEEFVALVRQRESGPRLRFSVEGPWPPYSFATLEGR